MTLHKLRVVLAAVVMALAAVSAVDSALAPAVAGEDYPLFAAPASGGSCVAWCYGP